MRDPRIDPTLVIVGLNRSGTTALAHSFLNHPEVELFKDPGKYKYESTGVPDFSHFFCDRLSESTRVRVIKQSVGQYTTDLCTIPVYPTGAERPAFLRRLHHVFLIRRPRLVWGSWQAMTEWLQRTRSQTIRTSWQNIVRDKGIPVGWGTLGLFHLASVYLFETWEYVRSISPETTHVVAHEDLLERDSAEKILVRLCSSLRLPYIADLVDWSLPFGGATDRLQDGFNRSMDNPERLRIHQTIRASQGLGVSVRSESPEVSWPDPILGRELENRYAVMLQDSRQRFAL